MRSTVLALMASALALTSAMAAPAPAAPRPGDRQYTVIDQHDATALLRAARSGDDIIKHGGTEVKIFLFGRGILLAVPGLSVAQKEVNEIRRKNPRVQLVVCKETLELLAKSTKRRPPLVPGTRIESCNNRSRELNAAGWQKML